MGYRLTRAGFTVLQPVEVAEVATDSTASGCWL